MTDVNEKQVYKKSLVEVVNYLNKENYEDTEQKQEIPYSKKTIRRLENKNKKKKIKREKRGLEEELKETDDQSACNKVQEPKKMKKNVKCATDEMQATDKLTRKERRKLKARNRGEGLSSKEYMKIVKETNGRRIEVSANELRRDHMASKTKSEYKQKLQTKQGKKNKRK